MSRQRLPVFEVRVVRRDERTQFDAALDEHHWFRTPAGRRDRTACRGRCGWDVTGGARVRRRGVELPAAGCVHRLGPIPAVPPVGVCRGQSAVLCAARRPPAEPRVGGAGAIAASSGDSRWDHPVLVVETFVDPARHQGTRYVAAGFTRLGATLGYVRSAGMSITATPRCAWPARCAATRHGSCRPASTTRSSHHTARRDH